MHSSALQERIKPHCEGVIACLSTLLRLVQDLKLLIMLIKLLSSPKAISDFKIGNIFGYMY